MLAGFLQQLFRCSKLHELVSGDIIRCVPNSALCPVLIPSPASCVSCIANYESTMGTFAKGNASTTCSRCPAGRYAPERGTARCQECENNCTQREFSIKTRVQRHIRLSFLFFPAIFGVWHTRRGKNEHVNQTGVSSFRLKDIIPARPTEHRTIARHQQAVPSELRRPCCRSATVLHLDEHGWRVSLASA